MTSATDTTFAPGIYEMPEQEYHQDPVPGGSLSCSGAKKLLRPSCPAVFAWEREHPKPPSAAMELGTAAHRLVLGTGQEIAVIDAKDWRTNKAKDAADDARAAGMVPLLTADHDQVQAMAAAIREHPVAGPLLCHGGVRAEQSWFWPDPEFGIWRRARFDSHRLAASGRVIITDYKTTVSADPGKFAKTVYDLRYHMQAAWYLDAADGVLGAATDAAFLFVAQEKTPPYLVTVCELDADAVRAGDTANRTAIEIYRDCQATGIWPGYQPENDIALISLPAWARTREDYP